MKAVIFDYWGTLVAHDPVHIDHAQALGCPEVFAEVWEEWAWRRMTTHTSYASLLEEVCKRARVPADAKVLSQLTEERRRRQAEILFGASEGILDCVRACRDVGLRVGIVSNSSCEDVEVWGTGPLADLVDVPVFSCDVGTMKPDTAIFDIAVERLGVPAIHVAVISDAVNDLWAARRAGIVRGALATWFGAPDPMPILPPRGSRLTDPCQVIGWLAVADLAEQS